MENNEQSNINEPVNNVNEKTVSGENNVEVTTTPVETPVQPAPSTPAVETPVQPVPSTPVVETPVTTPSTETNQQKKENKNNPILLVIIILLIAIIGYLVYTNYISKDNTNQPNNNPANNQVNNQDSNQDNNQPINQQEPNNNSSNQEINNKSTNLKLADVTILVDKYYGSYKNTPLAKMSLDSLTEEYKIGMAINSISESEFTTITLDKLVANGIQTCEPLTRNMVKLDTVKAAYKNLFNIDMNTLAKATTKYGTYYEMHNIDGIDYYIDLGGCGGGGPVGKYTYTVTDFNEDNNQLTVTLNITLVNSTELKEVYDDNTISSEFSSPLTYKLTFEKENDNYILKSSYKA
ncbi:MAG: hypothetical protein IJ565_03540 [Bacilli bacterium]|nr:hypothetical protein [Bacilli bacterium]